jgi:hypothetical protein
MTTLEKIPFAIEFLKGGDFKSENISNVELNGYDGTFHKGKSVYAFELTPKTGAVKKNSVKYLWSIENGLWD